MASDRDAARVARDNGDLFGGKTSAGALTRSAAWNRLIRRLKRQAEDAAADRHAANNLTERPPPA